VATKAIVIGLRQSYVVLDSEEVTKTKEEVTKTKEEVTKTNGDKRVSNSIRGQGNYSLV